MYKSPAFALHGEDFRTIRDYIVAYGDNGDKPEDLAEPQLSKGLIEWDYSKHWLFKLFGNQLRLSRPVSVGKTKEMLSEELSRQMAHVEFRPKAIGAISSYWYEWVRKNFDSREYGISVICWLQGFFESHSNIKDMYIITNIIDGYIPKDGKKVELHFPNGKSYTIQRGASFCRVANKLLKLSGATGWEGLFEEFRLWQSQFLNQTKMEGNLVLSIHPIDFMSMSDNSSNWTSCMNWTDRGDYRAGTVEMMNSDNVIVAYLESVRTPFIVEEHEIPNKKWRTLIICSDEGIVNVKGYPYQSDELAQMCCEWLAQLMKDNMGIEMVQQEGDYDDYFDFSTEKMYNDFCDEKVTRFCYAPKDVVKDYPIRICYSGQWRCVCCGTDYMGIDDDYDDGEGDAVSSWVVCNDCGSVRLQHRCCICGRLINHMEEAVMDGEYYCSDHIDEYGAWDPINNRYVNLDDCAKVTAIKNEYEYTIMTDMDGVTDNLNKYILEDHTYFKKQGREHYLVNFSDLTEEGWNLFRDFGEIDF